jgi:LytR cell envelope-related transcriptional attenuator
MKQAEHSDTTVHPDVESSALSKRVRKSHRLTTLRVKLMKSTLIVLSVAFFITIYILANKINHASGEEGDYIPVVNSRSFEVEVLDGAGNMKAAQQMTNLLRVRGYDVVEMKRNNEGFEEHTIIFDRSGNLDAAKKLATVLGVHQNKVFQKIDRTLYLDITIVMGKDYSQLKAFQSSTERNIH